VGEDHREAAEVAGRILLLEDFADEQLVLRVDVGVEQTHDEPAHPEVHEVSDALAYFVGRERHQDLAGVGDPLAHGRYLLGWNERLRALGACEVTGHRGRQPVTPLTAAADTHRVGVPHGGDEPQSRPAALDQGVGAQRGRIADGICLREQGVGVGVELRCDVLHGAHEAERQVVMGRERLRGRHAAVASRCEAIGEGAADVNVDLHHARSPTAPSDCAACWAFSASTSISMSCVSGWPGGRYSASTCVPQPGQ